jgi:penicillin-binding protein 1C
MRNTSGVTGAGPIFHAVMEEVMKNEPKIGFARPPGMLEREVCKLSGKLPTKLCPAVRKEVFVAGTEPRIPDDTFQLLTIDLTNGLLVPEGCKIDETKKQTYAFFSIELRPWAREHGWPDPPTRISPRCSSASSLATESFSAVQITNPNDGDRFRLSPLLPLDAQRISFRATTDSSESVTWNIDGTDLGTGSGADHLLRWIPVTGNHVLRATGGGNVDEVVFDVIPFSDK